jgi:Purple acid Phosphatase, N-terminal domain
MVGFGAVAGLARATEGPLWHQDAFAATAPTLAYSTSPITAGHPGRVVTLPRPAPLDVTRRYGPAASVSFTDGLNRQTTYFYHVQLTGLRPGTRYHYQVSDEAARRTTGPRRCRRRRSRRSCSAVG